MQEFIQIKQLFFHIDFWRGFALLDPTLSSFMIDEVHPLLVWCTNSLLKMVIQWIIEQMATNFDEGLISKEPCNLPSSKTVGRSERRMSSRSNQPSLKILKHFCSSRATVSNCFGRCYIIQIIQNNDAAILKVQNLLFHRQT